MQVRESRTCLLWRSSAVPGQSDRDGGDRQAIVQSGQFADAAIHLLAIVHTRAKHELRMEVDIVPAQPLQVVHDLRALGIADQSDPQFRIRGVDRDVHRADPLLLDPSPVPVAQVRERHEAAVEHRVAVVVVHDVERPPHALWESA